ncbi:HNH endonuclease family protein [Lacticaseibacillus paracasei]|uniref:C2H2-type domain-containing protein n=1 Tax=Lacticaseibacillus paracasei TaxID=1597 RepID=A0A422M0Q4_LACPA|nr:DUF262 domain-containing protein [Lacticaseibacillus paracasei]RND51720.1 hypothetical protein FAM18113_02233 [Lacticaseibacillus paracasei]RND80216.1 hypothetical protein FAM18172_03097 [Lacticaseibacillus paracasei]
MDIKLHEITVTELTKNYEDSEEAGVIGYNGRLNIRPPYQREFVYNDRQRNAVIQTIMGGFPLNVMYWSVNNNKTPNNPTDDTYELIDGQQRTISICQYVNDEFGLDFDGSGNPKYFHNLSDEQKEKLMNYGLTIYFCEGTQDERLSWFKVINTVGEKLTDQELLNALYSGPFVTDAKLFFAKPTGGGVVLAHDYVSGNAIRQDLLEKALKWISNDNISHYMAVHQYDTDAGELKRYWTQLMHWIEDTFTNKRKEMKSVAWGPIYAEHKNDTLNPDKLEQRVSELMMDDDVTKKAGIYDYVLTGDERKLSIRAFTPAQKRQAYERQKGICPVCGKHYELKEMEADHITPWHSGGKTIPENCQMLCLADNRTKSGK